MIGVQAKEYYTEYGEFTKWSTKYVESSDLVYVEEKRFYKYYHEDIVGDYYLKGDAPPDYIIDESNYKYGEYTDYSTEIPSIIDGRIIDSKLTYEYKKLLPIQNIAFYEFYGDNRSLIISEIKVFDKSNNEIDYTIICNRCSNEFSSHLHDGNIYDKYSIQNDSSIILKLDSEHYYDDIVVKVYIYDPTDIYKTFYIGMLDKGMKDYILSYSYMDNFKSVDESDIKEITFDYNGMNYKPLYSKNTSEVEVIEDKYTIVNKKYLYRYKDIYYYYYKINPIYSGYLEEGDEYYNKKTDDYKTYYRYKKREKVDYDSINNEYKTLKKEYDKLVTTNNKNVNNYNNLKTKYDELNNSYKDSKKVITDLNKEIKNSTNSYNKLSKTYDTLLNKYDKLENSYNEISNSNKTYIDLFKDKENEIKGLNTQNDKLNKDIDDLNLIYKDTLIKLEENLEDYNNMIEEINNSRIEANSYAMEVEECKTNLSIKEEEKNKITKEFENELLNLKMEEKVEEVKTFPILKIGNNYIYILPIIFLILILLILFILRNKKKH